MALFRDLNDNQPKVKPEVNDIESIRQSILDLLLTNEGEVPFNPEYGLSLPNYLFELTSDVAEFEIMSKISSKLTRFDNRSTLDIANSSALSNPDTGKMGLDLHFEIEGLTENGFSLKLSV
jgi:phage baseplate assembly protein W